MDTLIYFLLVAAYVILFLISSVFAKKIGFFSVENVLLIVIAALLYDNGILAIGKYIGEGELLRSLNAARYVLHALITPLLILVAWRTLVCANIKWAKKPFVIWLTVIFTLGSIVTEFVTEVRGINLKPAWHFGVLSYDKVNQTGNVPIMIIVVMAVLIITSINVWWKQKWPIYFLGVAAMGIVPFLIDFIVQTDAAHNVGELLLIGALLGTVSFQQKKRHRA